MHFLFFRLSSKLNTIDALVWIGPQASFIESRHYYLFIIIIINFFFFGGGILLLPFANKFYTAIQQRGQLVCYLGPLSRGYCSVVQKPLLKAMLHEAIFLATCLATMTTEKHCKLQRGCHTFAIFFRNLQRPRWKLFTTLSSPA